MRLALIVITLAFVFAVSLLLHEKQRSSTASYDLPRIQIASLSFSPRNRPYLWMCWTGQNPMPAYLRLCVDIVKAFNEDTFEVTVVTPDNIGRFLTDVHPAYQHLSYVHRADYLRCLLLHHHGGLYMDVDTLCFAPLREIARLLPRFDVVGYDGAPWGELWGVSIMMGRRRTSYSSEWRRRLHLRLDQRQAELAKYRESNPSDLNTDCLGWTEILRDIVLPLSREMKTDISWELVPPRLISASNGSDLVQNIKELGETSACLILNNAMYSPRLKNATEADVLGPSDSVLFGAVSKAHAKATAFLTNKLACCVDACYVLNLDHRVDRWERAKVTTRSCFLSVANVTRHPAPFVQENGALGCLMGHLEMLRRAANEHPFENVLLLEDDVVPTGVDCVTAMEGAFSEPSVAYDWDVMLLACNVQSDAEIGSHCPLRRLEEGQTSAAYLVRSGYVQTLIEVFSDALKDATSNKWNDAKHSTDQCWKRLQRKDRWYVFSPALLAQGASYSDIEKRIVDYGL